ncbi:MAG: DNA polymerase III subunit delta' [Flavobacteriaceae bacterium]
MKFQDVLGQEYLKNHLIKTTDRGRIPHAQLFAGEAGSGTLPMAIAYARYVLCGNDNAACNLKFDALSHPDLHFIYPTVTTEDVKSKPKSVDFLPLWREFIKENPYGSLFDWYKKLGYLNKQGEIRVDDAQETLKTLALKSYEGGYKVLIIWNADKMNIATSNKLLKIIEEPPAKTLFILISENEQNIIQTIRSRCQVLHFGALSQQTIVDALVSKHQTEENKAQKIAYQAQGSYTKAIEILNDDNEFPFDQWFVSWVRTAFRAKGNPGSILGLITWSETIAALGKETQKKFLLYCIEIFRQAMLLNYQTKKLVYLEPDVENFTLEKFAPFVNGNNIQEIYKELSDAVYHIERNGNAKLILTDLSIKLTRLIHKK